MKCLIQLAKVTFFLVPFGWINAQRAATPDVGDLYFSNYELGVQTGNTGTSFYFSFHKQLNYKNEFGFATHLGILKSQNEYQLRRNNGGNNKGYYFGKVNAPAINRWMLSFRHLLFDRKRPNGVSISYFAQGGCNLTYLKPIYLLVNDDQAQDFPAPPEEVRYDPEIHPGHLIVGRSNHYKGWNEGFAQFGWSARGGFHFDFSQKSKMILAVDIGLCLDGYKKSLPLFYYGQNKSTFAGVFIGMSLGSKKLR